MENKTKYTDCIPKDFWKMTLEDCHAKDFLDAYSILARGFWCCENKIQEGKLLLTGINPSYSGEHYGNDRIKTRRFADLAPLDKKNGFWKKKEQQFGGLWNDDTMSYLDLFPIRESNQRLFEQVFKNPKLTKLRADILSITQDAIEEMKPRLIIHANRASLYYWGLVPETPWMGYSFELVDPGKYEDFPKSIMTSEHLRLFPFYRITGFSPHPERINQEKFPTSEKSSLVGSFFMEYVMEYRKKEDRDKMYDKDDWAEIWKWVKKHSQND